MLAKKILLIVASQGFQPIEYSQPKQILENAGYTVVTASNSAYQAISSIGTPTKVDLTIDAVNPKEYEGIFFIGGPGALEHLNNQKSYDLLQKAYTAHKFVGAICISPRILANAGILDGKKATGWDDDHLLANIFVQHSVEYVKDPVVVDERIITASGPSAAQAWAQAIIKALQ
jgi:protease I